MATSTLTVASGAARVAAPPAIRARLVSRRVAMTTRPRARARRARVAVRAADGDAPKDGNAFESADDWIANWKAGNFPRAKGWKFGDPSSEGPGVFEEKVGAASGEAEEVEEEETDLSARYGGDPNDNAYVFCHNLMSPPGRSFACMYLTDVMASVGVPLSTPDLRAPDVDSFTVTSALAALDEAVREASGPEKKSVRL